MTEIAVASPTTGPPPEPSGSGTRLGRPFWRTWSADLASGLGEGVRIGALPLLAVALDPSPAAVAAVWVAGGLPFLLVGPFAGVLSDRWRRHRRVMWVTDAVAAAAALVFALLVAGGLATIAVLVVFNFLVGSLATLRDNAATAIIPQLVPRKQLATANSRVESVQLLTIDLLGPPLGAVLFLLPAGMPFFLDAASYALAALLVFGLPRTLPVPGAAPAPAGPARSGAGVLAELREGAGWLWHNPVVRAVCVLLGCITLAIMSAMSVAVLYAFEVLGVGHGTYVVLLAVIAVGAVLGSLAAPPLVARLGRANTLRVAFLLAPAAFGTAALTSDALVATAALTTVGATVGISNVVSVTLRHELVPAELMGRVNSIYRLVAVGAGPVGAGLAGLTGELFGLRAPMVVSAVAAAAGLVVAFRLVPRRIDGDAAPTGADPASAAPAAVQVEVHAEVQVGAPGRPKRRSRLRRLLVGLLVLVVLLVAAATGLGAWTVQRSFPQVSGELAVTGLTGPVDVVRDAAGVPQIYADTTHDLFLAQGYVHAQDRFWQMDTQRAIAAGRLSEMFGPDQIEADTVVRTLGFHRAAETEVPLLSPAALANLQAYADGVNAYLAERDGAGLSVEYAVLALVAPDYRPAPWTVVDSMAWLKATAWNLRGNDFEESQRALLAADLPADRVEALFPPYDFTRQRPITDQVPPGAAERAAATDPTADPAVAGSRAAGALADAGAATSRLEELIGPSGPGIGSNSWVVAGQRTVSGAPLLANDPHLGPQLPSIWYQVGLHCRTVSAACPYDVTGFGFPGMPAVFIGHNPDIAWGLTNLGADVVDLYLEQVDGGSYLYRGEMLPLQTREEVIRVAGADPVTITVSATRHGPLLSAVDPGMRSIGEQGRAPGVPPGEDHAVALRWSALEPGTTMDAVFSINLARDWDGFREALRGFGAPAQSVVYADRQGHIGFQAIGQVPVRTSGDGRYPVPGWTGEHEWAGWIPFDDLPRELDPARGYVVTANNAAAGPAYPYLLTSDWPDGYRSERIAELIEAAGPLDADAMRRIQSDTLSPYAASLVPHLLRVEPGAAAVPARDLLRGWDGTQPADSAPAAYFNAVYRNLLRLTFTDDLAATPADPDPSGGGRWLDVVRTALDRPEDPFWRNDVDPRGLHTRDDVLRAAMDDAAAELTDRLGPDPTGWRWGARSARPAARGGSSPATRSPPARPGWRGSTPRARPTGRRAG